MGISPLYQRTECQICLMDPFVEDSELETCSWNGHHITAYEGLPSETRVIHGICQKCFLEVPVNTQLLKCFTCREPFPNRQRSLITVSREGVGVGALEPYLMPIALQRVDPEDFSPLRGAVIITLSFLGVAMTISSFLVNSEQFSRVFLVLGLMATGTVSIVVICPPRLFSQETRRGIQEAEPLPLLENLPV